MNTATLKLHCPDATGIVYRVSKFIFERGGNIINSNHHYEQLDERFFMWVHFDCSSLTVTKQQMTTDLDQLAQEHNMDTEINFAENRKRLALMVSKYDHCLYDLLLRHQYGEFKADISMIISNHIDLENIAINFKVPFFYIPVTKDTKTSAQQRLLELLKQHQIDLIVLARYMQIIQPETIDAYPNKIINVHHGFLPAFKGAKPYHQAYEKGVKLIGATSHFVTAELDTGPIIEQETARVNHSHCVDDLLAMGRDVEKKVLAKAVRSFIDDKIMVYKQRTIVFD
ncbi:MAG: formyltetrahydrofolate deformylase [Phycisphaerae bacterium]|nr:formyltetrahydrofolate deformylase [Phycisphaerae bacterium]